MCAHSARALASGHYLSKSESKYFRFGGVSKIHQNTLGLGSKPLYFHQMLTLFRPNQDNTGQTWAKQEKFGGIWRAFPQNKHHETKTALRTCLADLESSTYHLGSGDFWRVKSKFDQNLSKYFRFSIKIIAKEKIKIL